MSVQLRSRVRYLAVVLLAAGGLIAVAAGPAAAAPAVQNQGTYLALGDSVPFGYRGGQTPATYSDPHNFVGYPEKVAADLNLNLLNASCPGETTDSFLDAAAQSNGCENSLASPVGYRTFFPLHVSYTGSQLAYATHVLETTPNVRLVTVMLGANDGFICQKTTDDNCTSPAEIAALAQHVQQNLSTILRDLRSTGYRGQIVVVNYYALNYRDTQALPGTLGLDGAIDAAALLNRDRIASGFLAFLVPALRAGGSSTAAGLVLPGDVHPTDLGQRLLANAVEGALRL
jgi:lysophospholipase L1-like esterase